jgi:hypothetical protein
MSTPWFFDRLGIAPTRDARQIKRAYALALKAIDQLAEREAFETLRGAYEAALAWTGADAFDGMDAASVPSFPPAGQSPGGPPPDEKQGDGDGTDPRGTASSSGSTGETITIVDVPPLMQSSPAGASRDPEPPRPADRAVISNESYGASRLAIKQWMARVLDPGDTPLAEVLDQALADPRLVHLDSRSQLEAQIIDLLYRDSPDRAGLFILAAERFGWDDRNARPAGNAHQAEWIARVVNQQLLWSAIDATRHAAQRAAIEAARATETPKRQEAFEHGPALRDFDRAFPEWSELNLPKGRVAAWNAAYDALPEGWLRAAATRKRHPYLLRIASTVLLAIIIGTAIRSMLLPTSVEGLSAAEQKRRREAAAQTSPDTSTTQPGILRALPPKPPEQGPVLAFEITGPVTIDSCLSTHEFVHESNWLDVGDDDAVALLTTRALLCRQRAFWPQPVDPVLDCLRTERAAALAANRPEAPGLCRDTAPKNG